MRRWLNSTRAFSALYEGIGRPSIPPERLLRATLLQLLYSIRSERQLVERLEFDMLFRWFVGLSIDEKVFDASTFSKNRDRLLTHEIAQEFLSSLLGLPEVKGLLSAEHFSVDGTLLKAWASMKSFRPKDASGEGPGDPPSRAQRRGRLPQDEAVERDARLDDGQGRAPLPQRRRAGEPSRLSWPRLDGEPQRARGGGRGDLGDRNGRARGGGGFQPALAQGRDARRRQGLRRRGLRRGLEGARDRAARGDQRDGEQTGQGAQDRRQLLIAAKTTQGCVATNMQCSSSRSRMVFAAMCSGVEVTLESPLASLHLSGPIGNRDFGAPIAASSDLAPPPKSLSSAIL